MILFKEALLNWVYLSSSAGAHVGGGDGGRDGGEREAGGTGLLYLFDTVQVVPSTSWTNI